MIAFLQKKRTKIVVARHDFWAQNVPKMLLRPGLYPEARWGRSFPDPLASRQGREGDEESRAMEGRGREGGEGKGEGRRGVGVVVLGGISIPGLTRQVSGSAAKEMLLKCLQPFSRL